MFTEICFVHNILVNVHTVDVAKLVSFLAHNLLSTLNLRCLQKRLLDNDAKMEEVIILNTEDVVIVILICIEGEKVSLKYVSLL